MMSRTKKKKNEVHISRSELMISEMISDLRFNKYSPKSDPLILAVDTSCDETSVAILHGRKVLANIVSSQTELHKKWGGVVPDVARRAHEENLPKAYKEALKRARLTIDQINLVAATQGPGLAIDLEVGLNFCKELAINERKRFIPVNHMEGHLLSSLALNSNGNGNLPEIDKKKLFPSLGVLVSGKHTELIYVKDFGDYKKIGWTLDDAAGEAFDKFGRMLGFGYPGGPIVSEFAKKGNPNPQIELPIPMERSDDLNFSYSGLKTACLYKINKLRESGKKDSEWVNDFCYAFVNSLMVSIVIKMKKAINQNPKLKTVLAGGGVYKSEFVSRKIGSESRKLGLGYLLPEVKYRSDNAVMIGIAGYFRYMRGESIIGRLEISKIDRIPRLSL